MSVPVITTGVDMPLQDYLKYLDELSQLKPVTLQEAKMWLGIA